MNGSQETGAMPADMLDYRVINLRGRVLHSSLTLCQKLFVDVRKKGVHFFKGEKGDERVKSRHRLFTFWLFVANRPAKVF